MDTVATMFNTAWEQLLLHGRFNSASEWDKQIQHFPQTLHDFNSLQHLLSPHSFDQLV